MRVVIKDGKVFEGVDIVDIVTNMKRQDYSMPDKNWKYRKLVGQRVQGVDVSNDEAFIRSLIKLGLLEVEGWSS